MNQALKPIILQALLLLLAFAACNNEPPECATEPFPPLRCQLTAKSGRKIDSVIIYVPKLDSILFKGKGLPSSVAVPLDITGDTTLVQFTIIGVTETITEKWCSSIGVASQPEMSIVNLSCGAFYIFRDLDYTMYSIKDYQPVYETDTVYVKAVDSVPFVRYDTTFVTASDSASEPVMHIEKVSGWRKFDTTYMYIDTRKAGIEYFDMPMAIDSIHYFTDEVDQDNETHSEIFF